ncbi:metal-binding protein [Pseudomonas eucalypticola]|uniref:Metal-binding protein n=1 Tax=Pseudomonas eucalypticola TaxID=2599595 RepID=A0A7D5GZT7_9PSED|nr:metal-binding protein [Pseudomonas eucalypticola]QKZ04045.1 metal-binding protein [Pseudomonas eucalypticola]
MGAYSESLTERCNHTRIKAGFCLICGGYGKLSSDHVPPRCCVTITRTEQRHITESLDLGDRSIKGVSSTNGSRFKTICQCCNNLLGRTDGEVGQAYRNLKHQVVRYFQSGDQILPMASAAIDSISYARSMLGHLLAATIVKECETEPTPTAYFDPLKRFVLGDDHALDQSHDIHYWFYPSNVHISAKLVAFSNEGHQSCLSLLSFFPVAFMVTAKGEGTWPVQARQLSFSDDRLILDLSVHDIRYVTFSFVELKGNQFFALAGQQAIISYPVGQ